MTYSVSKEFSFSAAHQLKGLPLSHPCSRLHGHNYTVSVEIIATALDDVGFVIDYRDLDVVKEYLDEKFDHRCLNDQIDVNPTAENLAKWIHNFIAQSIIGVTLRRLHGQYDLVVGVAETPKTWATYSE